LTVPLGNGNALSRSGRCGKGPTRNGGFSHLSSVSGLSETTREGITAVTATLVAVIDGKLKERC